MGIRRGFRLSKIVLANFMADESILRAAALAFFAVLSLAPLLTIIVSIAGLVGPEMQQAMVDSISGQMGPEAGAVLEQILRNAAQQRLAARVSVIIGFAVLLFSSTAVFVQLQKSLNRIWAVHPKPKSKIWGWLRKRLISVAMVFGVGFILVLSVVVSSVLNYVLAGRVGGIIWQVIDFLIIIVLFTLLFGMIFRFLPDIRIKSKDVFAGAAFTAVLFALGRYGLVIYFSRSTVGSAYGAAGSLLVLLLWIYYSALLLYLGAEVTEVYAMRYGEDIQPADYAEHSADYEEQKRTIMEA